MEQPLAVIRHRAPVWRVSFCSLLQFVDGHRLALPLILAILLFFALPAHAAPSFWLPTPPGERWKIIQGYGCGTHNSWDRYALDLASADGTTYGAPVHAAADGTVFVWEASSGTLIVDVGAGLYTQYTHMSSTAVRVGAAVRRGDLIGAVGDRGAKGNPHLHFHVFSASGAWASNRKTVPLSFAEGYSFPEIGGCNQHHGEIVVTGSQVASQAGLNFRSEAQPGRWYNHDLDVTFTGSAMARGFSLSWNGDPGGDAPMQPAAAASDTTLTAQSEGLHTLYVRGWDSNGQQTLATFGPVGFDTTPPVASAPIVVQEIRAATADSVVRWNAAQDAASGVAGYHVYLGPDANGTSDWYVATPETTVPALAAGGYTLRVQPVDFAGNTGAWATVGQVVAQ